MDDLYSRGRSQALALGNRGPLAVDANGRVDGRILDAYWRTGFYVFEGALRDEEVAELRREFESLRSRAPIGKDATVDAEGREAVGDDRQRQLFRFVKPLTDPYGETEVGNGRYQVKMREPDRPADAPAEVLLQIGGIMQFLDSALRIYAHPQLLAMTEAVNGADFTPFNEVIWIKQARLGAAVSWHQDGTTHWQSPTLDAGTHGFNFMVNLYPTTPENALWVVPGTHDQARPISRRCWKRRWRKTVRTASRVPCRSCASRATWRSATAKWCMARFRTRRRRPAPRSSSASTAARPLLA